MSTTPPQFGTAEYKSATGGETCRACKQTITGEYYRVNGVQACAACMDKVKQQIPKDTHAAFMRGILFGVGGAIAGLIVYSVFGIVTGIMIGYVSLAVGWLVGKAIRLGSKGVGGRRYQIVAVLLTYAAVSIGAVPIWISQVAKQEKSKVAVAAPSQESATNSSSTGESAPAESSNHSTPAPSWGNWLGTALLIGLASPFLKFANGPSAIIGLVILAVGMNIAWKLTSAPKLDIIGPFKASEPVAA